MSDGMQAPHELDNVDQCCNWMRDLMLEQDPPGVMAAEDFEAACKRFESTWGKVVIKAAVKRLSKPMGGGQPALMERGEAGSYTFPYMIQLHEAGML